MTFTSLLIDLLAVLLILYCLLILLYRQLWVKLESARLPQPLEIKEANLSKLNRFSVIIPARNEADNIETCLASILEGSYPKSCYEIIVVDDYSTDRTLEILRTLQLQHPGQLSIIELASELESRPLNSYKKKALELAIASSTGNWIVTTDADCQVPADWLYYYEGYIRQTGKRFVAAPVRFTDTGSFISKFQCLDFLSLQGVTGAAVGGGLMSMCNGANLGYEKAFFHEVGGFTGIDQLASGDDMFLMQKMQEQLPGSTGYLFAQEAIVSTLPMPNWASFINQRIRWASKAGAYKDWKIKSVLLIVYLLNLCLLVLFIAGLFQARLLLNLAVFILIKFLVEIIFMWPVAGFFKQTRLLRWFLLMQPLHVLYTVIAGWLGLFGKYKWKGRSVK